MGRRFLQVLNLMMLLLFIIAAVVQYNDADALPWMLAYGAGALCCALFATGRLPPLLSGAVSALCLLGALYLLVQIFFGPIAFFDTTGHEMMGLVEETREMFGLLITATWAGVLTWRTGWVHTRSPA